MPRIHYKSDFDFILTLLDKDGRSIGFPPCDFTVTLTSGSSARRFTASCIGGECTNLFNDDGQIHIVADGHGLAPGHLRATVELTAPDSLFPDGSRRLIHPAPLDIDLILGPSDIPTDLTASLRLPLLKGENGADGKDGAPFTYADFPPSSSPLLKAKRERKATVASAELMVPMAHPVLPALRATVANPGCKERKVRKGNAASGAHPSPLPTSPPSNLPPSKGNAESAEQMVRKAPPAPHSPTPTSPLPNWPP